MKERLIEKPLIATDGPVKSRYVAYCSQVFDHSVAAFKGRCNEKFELKSEISLRLHDIFLIVPPTHC